MSCFLILLTEPGLSSSRLYWSQASGMWLTGRNFATIYSRETIDDNVRKLTLKYAAAAARTIEAVPATKEESHRFLLTKNRYYQYLDYPSTHAIRAW